MIIAALFVAADH